MARDEDRQRGSVEPGGAGGPDFAGLIGDLTLAVGRLGQRMDASAKPTIPWEAAHPVWFTGAIPLTSGAGTLQVAGLYGPTDPYWWDLRTLTLWGMTGTSNSVTVYKNSTNGEQILEADQSGQANWSSQILLAPLDQLVFSASSITGNVYLTGVAIEVETAWLPAYLM